MSALQHPEPSQRAPLAFVTIDQTTPLFFEDFYRDQYPRLAGSLRLVAGDEAIAEELAQEAFTRALQHWRKVSTYDSPTGWLYRVAFNLLRTHWRKSRRDNGPLIDIAQQPAVDGDRIDLMRLLAQLPLSQREAVVLRHILDYSTDEAADLLGVKPGAFRMMLHRAVTKLREQYGIDIDEKEGDR